MKGYRLVIYSAYVMVPKRGLKGTRKAVVYVVFTVRASSPLICAFFAWIIGNQSITNANSLLPIQSANLIFGVLGVTCVCGVFASLARGRVHEKS
jgi:hypothetical protein